MNTENNKRPVIVGIFILTGILILAVTIFTLGGQKETFVPLVPVHVIFNDVGGLQVGGNIRFSGVKVGTVKKLGFHGNSQVLVTMNIERAVQAHIPKNAFAKIGSDGLIGNKIIIIYGGNPTQATVEANDYLKVEKALSTDDMLATLQENNRNLLEITADFKSISRKIDRGTGTLATLINNGDIARKLEVSADDLQKTLANLKTASLTSQTIVSDIQGLTGKFNQPGNSIRDLANDTLVYKNVKETVASLQRSAGSLDQFTNDLKKISSQLNKKNNIASIILNDSAMASSFKITLRNLESGSYKLNEDLEALQHSFLLKNFFKKKK
jgi:phospholipid/cholesterol/gamma-HCH transport system substrate-binding protein